MPILTPPSASSGRIAWKIGGGRPAPRFMKAFDNLRSRRALALSFLLAACGGQVGGSDSESHFLCRSDQDCERLEGGYACVQGECRLQRASISDETAQQGFPVEPLSCLSYTATLCPDNALCTPYRATLYDTFNGCLGQERAVACGAAGRSCDDVPTLATDEDGHCYVFPSSCLPTGWTAASEAVDAAADCQAALDPQAPLCALEPHTCEGMGCFSSSAEAQSVESVPEDAGAQYAGVSCEWAVPQLAYRRDVRSAHCERSRSSSASGVNSPVYFVEEPARCGEVSRPGTTITLQRPRGLFSARPPA